MKAITLTNDVLKRIAKVSYYSEESFVNDANDYIESVRNGLIFYDIHSVSKSGMSRRFGIYSKVKRTDGSYSSRNFCQMFKALGFSVKDCFITVSGCGMDMVFYTNYNTITMLSNMGFECKGLEQSRIEYF